MEQQDMTQLDQLKQQMLQAKRGLNIQALQRKLTRYHDFVLNFKTHLGAVESIEDFRTFRAQWQETGSLASLPKELSEFHAYLALAEQYNAQVIGGIANGEQADFMRANPPMLISEAEMDILDRSSLIYDRPFNWERLRTRLIGNATRNAIFTHLVACALPDEVLALISEGTLKKETIIGLPYLIPLSGAYGNGVNDEALYEAYHAHLAELYDHFGMTLPPVLTFKEEPLKGVTFEGRSDKLRYLLSHVGAFGDSDPVSYNKRVQLCAERYTYTPQDGAAEPAIRVIASIPGDRNFQRVDIGNLDRNLALELADKHPDAAITVAFQDIDFFDRAGNNGTVRQPYAKLCVQVADKPYEKERQMQENYSKEVDQLFDMEALK